MSTLQSYQARANNLASRVEAQKMLKEDLEKKLAQATEDRKDKGSAHLFLQYLAKRLNEGNELQAAKLATLGLQEVFSDLNLTLELEHTESRGNSAVVLKLKDHDKGVTGDPVKSFGGGPASLLGIILRVITTVRQKTLTRVLILDEPMSQISSRYKEKAAKLLRKMCEPVEKKGLGFDMLVITHDPVFMAEAHRSYVAETSEDGKSLVLKENKPGDESD